MNITILTYGSRGDVQPFLALALGLQRDGHTVKLAAPHRFANFAARRGVPFVPLAGDPEVISERLNAAGTNPLRAIAAIQGDVSDIAPQVSRTAFAACEGADLLIHSFLFRLAVIPGLVSAASPTSLFKPFRFLRPGALFLP